MEVGLPVARVEAPLGDELVYVLVAAVVAHVRNRVSGARQDGRRALVGEAAERGVFGRYRLGIVGIDLHHPPEPVGLVGILHEVEAVMEAVPAVAAGAHTVPLVQRPKGRIG